MSATLTIKDETAYGESTNTFLLNLMTERISIRELIRERVYEEVRQYNASLPEYFKGLVQPTEAETTLNGYKVRNRRRIDWENQYALAIEAFERNGFFVLVDDHQAGSLDEEILITPTTEVSF